MIHLDRTDHKILKHLQTNGRMTNSELADKINLSPSACLRRVQRLENDKVIDGYVMLINQEAVGKPTNIFVEVSLTSQSVDSLNSFEEAVRNCPDIMECFLMSGNSDYLMKIAAADTQDYERIHKQYLSHFPNVARIKSNFALRTVCKNTELLL